MTVEDFAHSSIDTLGTALRSRRQGEARHPGGEPRQRQGEADDGAAVVHAQPTPQSWPRIFPGL